MSSGSSRNVLYLGPKRVQPGKGVQGTQVTLVTQCLSVHSSVAYTQYQIIQSKQQLFYHTTIKRIKY